MDITAILRTKVGSRRSLQEFIDDLTEQIPNIERDIARLKLAPGDKDLIARLFRALHNVKGNASICGVEIGVAIAHPLEALLARLRTGEIGFSDLLAEAILLAMDRLELSLEALAGNRALSSLKLLELVGGLEGLARTDSDAIDDGAVVLIEAVNGFRPVVAARARKANGSVICHSPENVAADLRFFRSLSFQFEARSPLFKGRSERLLQLALDTNQVAGNPVAPAQLEAAVYMHDVGMMFLPESVWLKVEKLDDDEKRLLHGHPAQAAGLLERMAGWQGAARMVAEHHEMPEGRGYPKKLKAEEISPGAKILAIMDAFEAVTLKHRHRGQSRSILRAIAEVNACDNQFAPEWIGSFNAVIRRIVEA